MKTPFVFSCPQRCRLATVVVGAILLWTIFAASEETAEEFEDFYKILEVDRRRTFIRRRPISRTTSVRACKGHATAQEIKRAYRRLSLENHPDVASPSDAAAAAKKFHKLTEAYEVLSKLSKRRLYDLYGKDFILMEDYFEEASRRGGKELYKYKRGVFLLYERNVEALLTHRPYTWILSFAQPGCGNCERNVPIFSRLGEKTMETKNVRLAMVNCLISNLCHYFNIDYLGQVFFLPPDQEGGGYWDKKEYSGPLSADRILEAALAIPPPNMQEIESEDVIMEKLSTLSPASRPSSLTTASSVDFAWLVDYYKPSCMPCRQTKSELRQISSELQDKLTISFINCDKQECADIPYFPYARLFVKGFQLIYEEQTRARRAQWHLLQWPFSLISCTCPIKVTHAGVVSALKSFRLSVS